MTYGGVNPVARFADERAARTWAARFDHARSFSGVSPLYVKRVSDDEWGVWNPDFETKPPRTRVMLDDDVKPKREPVRW